MATPNQTTAIADELLTPEETAELVKTNKALLAVWRHRKIGPPFVQLSPRMPRYWRSAVLAWIASRGVEVQP